MERLCIFIHIYNKPYISLWPIRSQFDMDLARAPRRARLTARKKGSGYENGSWYTPFSYPEPFLRAVNGARRGALAKSISNWHLIGHNEGCCSNNVYISFTMFLWFPVLDLARAPRRTARKKGSGYENGYTREQLT